MRALPGKTGKEKTLVPAFNSRTLSFCLIAALFGADRLLKVWTEGYLPLGESRPFLGKLVYLTHIHNTGAAFGMWKDAGAALTVFSALSVIGISVYIARSTKSNKLPWVLIAGGAAGNWYDRAVLGYVIDYIDLRFWPVFNFADICICGGVALVFLAAFCHSSKISS